MKRKSRATAAQLRARTAGRKTSRLNAPRAKTSRAKASRSGTSRAPVPRSKIALAGAARPKSSREKVKAYRERMRKRGMKLIQIWVPDPKSPYFFAEARRQARLIANSPHEKEDQAFIDSISEWKPD
jgi:hypothetical protein